MFVNGFFPVKNHRAVDASRGERLRVLDSVFVFNEDSAVPIEITCWFNDLPSESLIGVFGSGKFYTSKSQVDLFSFRTVSSKEEASLFVPMESPMVSVTGGFSVKEDHIFVGGSQWLVHEGDVPFSYQIVLPASVRFEKFKISSLNKQAAVVFGHFDAEFKLHCVEISRAVNVSAVSKLQEKKQVLSSSSGESPFDIYFQTASKQVADVKIEKQAMTKSIAPDTSSDDESSLSSAEIPVVTQVSKKRNLRSSMLCNYYLYVFNF